MTHDPLSGDRKVRRIRNPHSPQRRMPCRDPIVPDRVRRIDGQGFSFLPNRFMGDGFFVALTRDELAMYLLLILVGDRNGISFYHYDRLCSILELTGEGYIEVRNALIGKDLIAYDGTRYQVLSLPARPVPRPSKALKTPQDFEDHDPATIRHRLQEFFGIPDDHIADDIDDDPDDLGHP